MKVFSGSEILAMALKEKIEAIGVGYEDNIQSARLAGFEARFLLWRFYTRN
jgi:hypothetical protein